MHYICTDGLGVLQGEQYGLLLDQGWRDRGVLVRWTFVLLRRDKEGGCLFQGYLFFCFKSTEG